MWGKTDKTEEDTHVSTMIVGDFNNPLSEMVDAAGRKSVKT